MADLIPRPSRRAAVLVAAGAGTAVAGYVAYRYWLKEYLERRLGPIAESASSAWRMLESLGAASDLSTTVVSDLKAFLESDTDEVPRSVRQMLKLSRSPEFQQAVLCSTQSVTEGITLGLMRTADPQGQQGQSPGQGREAHDKGLVEVVLEKLFTEEGKGFASAVCSRMVRTLVASLQGGHRGQSPQAAGHSEEPQFTNQQPPWHVQMLELLCTEQGKGLLTTIIQTFAVSSVGTYIDKTSDINMYHDILAAVRSHPDLVKDLSAHVVSTTVREAMHSWQSPRPRHVEPRSESSSSCSSSPRVGLIPMSAFSESDSEARHNPGESSSVFAAAEVGHYLAQPEIRSIILDVTGTVTAKGMEAFLLVLFYKLFGGGQPGLLHLAEGRDEASDLTREPCAAPRYQLSVQPRLLASRALAIVSVCLAVVIHYASL